MPRRELRYPAQIEEWLVAWGQKMQKSGEMILIGSGGLLWHAAQRKMETPLPENSMDVDPITQDEEVAELGYDAHIGSAFEKENGWHVNLMPKRALDGLPSDWRNRQAKKSYGLLTVIVPSAQDLLVPKLLREKPGIFRIHNGRTRWDCAKIIAMPELLYDLEDQARLDYSRLLWGNAQSRRRLLYVWEHPEHPHREHFEENRRLIVGLLECENPQLYVDSVKGEKKWSLRTLIREIPCVIWELWDQSRNEVLV